MTKKPLLSKSDELIVITGGRGVGKTIGAATYLPPDQVHRIYFIDDEKSGNNFREGLLAQGKDFGHYLDMQSRFSDLPDDDDLLFRIKKGQLPWVDTKMRSGLMNYYLHIIDDLNENLERGKFDVLVIDTIQKMEAGMAAWVEKNKSAAGVTTTAYGKLWTEGVYPLYEQLLASVYARGVKTIIFTSHLRTPWEGNRPVAGKAEPAGKKILYFLSRFMVWLVNNPENDDGAPAGLVLKERFAHIGIENNSWNISRRIPKRIPHFSWDDVRWYLENGCNLKNPPPEETPSEDEAALITDMITDKQMELMLLEAKRELVESQKSTSVFVPTTSATADGQDEQELSAVQETIREIVSEGHTDAKTVRDKVANRLGVELPLPTIVKELKNVAQ